MNRCFKLAVGIMTIGSLFAVDSLVAQEQPTRRNKAKQLYDKLEYANAAAAYERVVDVKNPNTEDLENLANSYLYLNAYDLAANMYARVVARADASQSSLLNYAKALQQQGKYDEAKEQYQTYSNKYGATAAIERLVQGTDSAQFWMKNPTVHKLRNEEFVNTETAQFGVYPTSNGALYAMEPNSLLAKKSGMTGQSYLRVYSAERGDDGALYNPNIMLGAVNQSLYHVGPIIANANEDVLYVTRTYSGKDSEKFYQHGNKWRKQNLELILFYKDGDSWREEKFPYNKVEEYSLGHAALSADGKVLYYASDMPGGKGGVDIWYSELESDGSWGKPQNAGSTVNTDGDEMFPSVEGGKLYFSSTGHVGMGGLDLFTSKGDRSTWTKATNLGYPINSASDDFAYVVTYTSEDEYTGYLSSNRVGGKGSDDIYSFHYRKPKITILLAGITKNKSTGASLPGSIVTLFAPDRSIVTKGVSDKDAVISFALEPNTEYRLLGEKKSFFPDSLLIGKINAQRDTTIRLELNLQPVFEIGSKFVLENIYYDFDKHFIRPDAALILDKLVEVMRANPTLKIELSSHTDSRGTNKYNIGLSQRRAQAAVDYIVRRGVARDRMVAKGYGETRLVNRCADGVSCTAAEHQANRRTEVEVLDF